MSTHDIILVALGVGGNLGVLLGAWFYHWRAARDAQALLASMTEIEARMNQNHLGD